MAANLAMALDEIIKSQKGTGGGGGGKRLAGGRRREAGAAAGARTRPQRSFVSGEVPAGRWKHDKFMEVYGGGRKRTGGGSSSAGILNSLKSGGRGSIGARLARKSSGGASNGMVKLQISNLPDSVVTSDLEELFQDFNVFGVAVHYDEMGSHLGTADMFTDQQSASNILGEFKNIAIDGQEIKFCLVTEGASASTIGGKKASIRDRLQRVSTRGAPIRKKVGGGGGQVRRRISGGSIKRVATAGGKRGGGGGVAKAAGAGPKVKTAEQLDDELEAYMKKL